MACAVLWKYQSGFAALPIIKPERVNANINPGSADTDHTCPWKYKYYSSLGFRFLRPDMLSFRWIKEVQEHWFLPGIGRFYYALLSRITSNLAIDRTQSRKKKRLSSAHQWMQLFTALIRDIFYCDEFNTEPANINWFPFVVIVFHLGHHFITSASWLDNLRHHI